MRSRCLSIRMLFSLEDVSLNFLFNGKHQNSTDPEAKAWMRVKTFKETQRGFQKRQYCKVS